MDIVSQLKLGIQAALAGGEEILKIYDKEDLGVQYKEDNSPLTLADLASNEAITAVLIESKLPILSEEGREIDFDERKNWEYLWIVDPLDGTKEFVKRNGEFTVNIALVHNNEIVAGVVYTPVTKELYFASQETGSKKILVRSTLAIHELFDQAISLPCEKTNTFTIVASRSHPSIETAKYIERCKEEYGEVEILSRGSSLKLCMVAEGKANCYPRFAPTMEWDTAAGQAICKFSGASVIDYETKKEMIYNRENLLNNWFLVERVN